MISDETLRELLITLVDLEETGLLDELLREHAEAAYPRRLEDPSDALTDNQKDMATRLADLAAGLFDIPRGDALRVATELFAPSPQDFAIELVWRYVDRLHRQNGGSRTRRNNRGGKPGGRHGR